MIEGLVERLYRRVMMMVGRGRITATDDTGLVQIVQLRLGRTNVGELELADNVPRVAEYGFVSVPLPGADAVLVYLGGDRSSGAVIATADPRYRLHLQPGEVAIHDNLGRKVHLAAGGIVIDGGGQDIAVLNAPHVTVTGGDVVADGISLKTHRHNATTGAPQ